MSALGGEERFQHMRQDGGGNAAAGVGDRDFNRVCEIDFVCGDGDGTAFLGHRFGGIEQQVHENLRELVGVGSDGGKIVRDVRLQLNGAKQRLVPQKRKRVLNQASDVYLGELQWS